VYGSSARCLLYLEAPVKLTTNQDFYFSGGMGTLCKLYN